MFGWRVCYNTHRSSWEWKTNGEPDLTFKEHCLKYVLHCQMSHNICVNHWCNTAHISSPLISQTSADACLLARTAYVTVNYLEKLWRWLFVTLYGTSEMLKGELVDCFANVHKDQICFTAFKRICCFNKTLNKL